LLLLTPLALFVWTGQAPLKPDPPRAYQHTPTSLLVVFCAPKSHGKPLTAFLLERAEIKPLKQRAVKSGDASAPDDEAEDDDEEDIDGDDDGDGGDVDSVTVASSVATAGTGTAAATELVWVKVPLPAAAALPSSMLTDAVLTVATASPTSWHPSTATPHADDGYVVPSCMPVGISNVNTAAPVSMCGRL
jgi:hypothetical protein